MPAKATALCVRWVAQWTYQSFRFQNDLNNTIKSDFAESRASLRQTPPSSSDLKAS